MVFEIIIIVSFSTVFGGIGIYRNFIMKSEEPSIKKKLITTYS